MKTYELVTNKRESFLYVKNLNIIRLRRNKRVIRIAIVDDEEMYLEKEKKITEAYFSEKQVPYTIETYQNVEWFLYGLKEEAFDLYILDVEMPGKNGIQAAKEIRKLYPDPVIIFITNYIDYAVDAYEVNTYRYIPKMVLEKKLPESYDSLLPELLEKEERYYVIEKRGGVEKIAYSDIFYIKKEGKNTVFVHKRGESKLRISLVTVLDELNSGEFYQIDKGCIANLRHVMKMKGYDLYMRDGMILPIGEARFQGLKRAILEYWG